MIRRSETRSGHARSNVLVLGLGNPLRGDDGVGPRVVAELEDREVPEGVELLDGGTGGLDLLQIIEGQERVVIVDAAQVDAPGERLAPGQFVRFTPDEARLTGLPGDQSSRRFSFHHAGVAEVLDLARALGRPLPRVVIFGVQPQQVGWGEGLSADVERNLPALVDAVLEEVNTR